MPLNDVVTHAFRSCGPHISSTIALVDHARDDFGSAEGLVRLSRLLGLPTDEVSLVLRETMGVGMNRLAFHYGYMPFEESDRSWRFLPMTDQPFDSGPRCRWNDRKIAYVRDVLTGDGESRPSARVLAWRMDTTEERLRDALRRRRISLRT